MKKLSFFLLTCSLYVCSFSQTPLVVGDQMPDWKFTPIINAPAELTISELKGKVVILGFWVSSCSVCYAILPKLAELQMEFKNSLKVILVSDDKDPERVIKKFEKRKYLKDLGLPIMVKDKELLKLFPHDSDPHIILMDAKGIIKGITGHESLTRQNIEKLIKGENVFFPNKSLQFIIDSDIPLLDADINRNSFLYSSILTQEIPGLGPNFHFKNIGNSKVKLLVSNLNIIQLYRHAYSPLIRIVSVDVPTRFIMNINDSIDLDKKYCYELILPYMEKKKRNLNSLAYMRKDLDKFFQWNSHVEKRKVLCYVISTPDSSGNVNENEFYVQPWLTTTEFNNAPLSVIAGEIKRIVNDLPVIIEGNQKNKFSMVLQKNYKDFKSLESDLHKYGISIEKREREIDFLVIQNQKS